jgi:outer membrane protein OmpA-like peptidoglycan-associated protein
MALASALPTSARAQEMDTYLRERVAAPSDALELRVGTAYTQGFGNIAPGRRLSDAGGPGFGVGAEMDYRLTHAWSVGMEGQYQEFAAEQNSSSRGLTTNIGATYHFDPIMRADPWARLGTGYRLIWENDPRGAPGTNVLRHGFEVLTAKVGYDIRVSEDVALGPVVGADFNMLAWQENNAMSQVQLGTFVYAGLQGRFDVGGERGGLPTVAYVPPPVGVTAPQPQAPAPPPPVAQPVQASPNLNVSEDILAACKMSIDSVEKAPKFDFDKSDLLPADIEVLKQIAECFTTGPMKDAGLRLVGRADPRGSIEYNDRLGMRRANSVSTHLGELGVGDERIDKISRGKRDARGTDEESWQIDRRVDIMVR